MPTRKCKRCKEEKKLSEFHFYDKTKNKRRHVCGTCRNSDVPKPRQEKQEYIYDYLATHPCVRCGCDDIFSLEFDHIDRTTKSHKIADYRYLSMDELKEEIEKCQVLCSSCHRKKTAIEQNYFVVKYLEERGIEISF